MNRNFYFVLLSLVIILCSRSQPATAQCPTLLGLPDTIVACKNTSLTLNPSLSTGTSFTPTDTTWSPAAGLSNPDIINPVVNVGTASAQYVLTIPAVEGFNAVLNGNFSSGNTGFSSNYYVPTPPYGIWGQLSNEATYTVTTNPHLAHTNFATFTDHTGDAAGMMMVINGASAPGTSIWCQTISVDPYTDYDFSAWGATCVAENPAILQFSINGTLVGTALSLPLSTGVWTEFHTVWNSGANTSANICIVDQQTAASGNDFALDDIAFRKVCVVKDSVYVRVTNLTPTISYNLNLGCQADSVSLVAQSGAGTVPDNITWSFGDGTTGNTAALTHVYGTQGNYNIRLLTEKDGCADSAQISINTLHPLSASFTSNKDSLCLGGNVTFTSTGTISGPGTYYYDFGDGDTSSAASPAHTYVTAGVYQVMQVVKDTLACTDTAYKTIVVWPQDAYDPDLPVSVCTGGTYTWAGTDYTIAGNYTRTFVNRHGCDSVMTLHLVVLPVSASTLNDGYCQGSGYSYAGNTYTAPGTYTVVFPAANGCDSTVTLHLEAWPVPQQTVKDTICEGGSYSFGGQVYTGAGSYTHAFTTSRGCDSIVTLQLAVNEIPLLRFVLPAAGCTGDIQPLTLSFADVAEGSDFDWDFGNGQIVYGSGGGPYGIRWQDTGWHKVIIHEYVAGCGALSYADSIYIHPFPDAQIVSATGVLCAFDTVTLRAAAMPGWSYQWSPQGWLTGNGNEAVAQFSVQQSGWLSVQVTNSGGCRQRDSIYISTENCCKVEMPDAFTPNGDGRNDVFRPVTRGHQDIVTLRIFNRWGQVIYESRDPKQGWDGTFNGQPQDMGTYTYFLSYHCTDGNNYERKGMVLLIR